jgi:3-methyladenine DNA glycosylase AlkD
VNVPAVDDLIARLHAQADPDNVTGMVRYGISPVGTLGVSMPVLRGIARELRPVAKADPDGVHALAAGLWASGVHEARILASLVDLPALVTREQADGWVPDVDSWDVCDGLCNNLLDKTPFAYEKAEEWAAAEPEFVKRAGFVLMCTRALHDKAAGDEPFLDFLAIVEREATDERPLVKKAVNWALRQIGKRNANLHAAAVVVASRLRDSESRAARWVASDALRELGSDAVLGRVAQSRT